MVKIKSYKQNLLFSVCKDTGKYGIFSFAGDQSHYAAVEIGSHWHS